MKNYLLLLLTSLLVFPVNAQDSRDLNDDCTLTVYVKNIGSEKGNISIGLYNNSESWLSQTYKGETGEINDGQTTVVFTGIPKGQYAISLFHDENENSRLDAGIFGIPKEPYACSNGAKGRFGPPKWKDAVFTIQSKSAQQIIKL